MADYVLVCDECADRVTPDDARVSWRTALAGEHGFTLTHELHVPADAAHSVEVRDLVSPAGYLAFAGRWIGRRTDDSASLRDILVALAHFVMRPDTAAEVDGLRAASFGARVGAKPAVRMSVAPKASA